MAFVAVKAGQQRPASRGLPTQRLRRGPHMRLKTDPSRVYTMALHPVDVLTSLRGGGAAPRFREEALIDYLPARCSARARSPAAHTHTHTHKRIHAR
jgi:hypothetical protein